MAIITLTSDIGNQDYLPGAIKGRLLRIDPAFQLVDITHAVPPFNYPQAAYVCRNAIRNFPEGSFHLVLVNLFDTLPRHLLIALHKNQYIACADNGLLTMILEETPEEVVAIPIPATITPDTLGITDVLGSAIRQIEAGMPLEEIGDARVSMQEKHPLRPVSGPGWMEGQIIFIDNFENVVVNITRNQFETERNGRRFKIVFKRDEVIDRISTSYADVPESEKLALFNASGYLEIAVNKGNAAGLFGLQGFSGRSGNTAFMQNKLFYQTVRIYFE